METGWPDALCGIGRGFDGVGPPGAGGAGGVCPVGGGWRLAEAAVPVRGGGKRAGLGTGAPGILPAPSAAGAAPGPGALAWGGPAAAWVRPAVSGFGLLFGQPHLAAVPHFPRGVDAGCLWDLGDGAGVLAGAPPAAWSGGGHHGKGICGAPGFAGGLCRPAGICRRAPWEQSGSRCGGRTGPGTDRDGAADYRGAL